MIFRSSTCCRMRRKKERERERESVCVYVSEWETWCCTWKGKKGHDDACSQSASRFSKDSLIRRKNWSESTDPIDRRFGRVFGAISWSGRHWQPIAILRGSFDVDCATPSETRSLYGVRFLSVWYHFLASFVCDLYCVCSALHAELNSSYTYIYIYI